MEDSDEEQKEDDEMLLACELVGKMTKFYVRARITWEKHISELTAEGNDAFQQLERSTFN